MYFEILLVTFSQINYNGIFKVIQSSLDSFLSDLIPDLHQKVRYLIDNIKKEECNIQKQ